MHGKMKNRCKILVEIAASFMEGQKEGRRRRNLYEKRS